jgi:hypothetical protein
MSDQNNLKLNWQDEEEKLMHRLEQRMKALRSEETSSMQRRERERDSGSDMDADALDSDLILGKLFFSSKLSALSPGIQFDSSIRYMDPVLSSPEQFTYSHRFTRLQTLILILMLFFFILFQSD